MAAGFLFGGMFVADVMVASDYVDRAIVDWSSTERRVRHCSN